MCNVKAGELGFIATAKKESGLGPVWSPFDEERDVPVAEVATECVKVLTVAGDLCVVQDAYEAENGTDEKIFCIRKAMVYRTMQEAAEFLADMLEELSKAAAKRAEEMRNGK